MSALDLRSIYKMSEGRAHAFLEAVRWPDGPHCPRCGGTKYYLIPARNQRDCTACGYHYSLTSKTLLSARKMKHGDLMAAAFIFCRAKHGISSVQLADTLGCEQRTAWRLSMLFRRALHRDIQQIVLKGTVEVDGATFGGHVRLMNVGLTGNLDGRKYTKRHNARGVIVIAKQRLGRSVPIVVSRESEAKRRLTELIEPGSIVIADGAHAWDSLLDLYDMLRLNHAWQFAANGACTNNAESFFAGMRRLHSGTHGWFSRDNMELYAAELAWKRDMKEQRMSSDEMTKALLGLLLTGTQNG